MPFNGLARGLTKFAQGVLIRSKGYSSLQSYIVYGTACYVEESVESGVPEKWVIFDADNTLWDVEAIYDHARKRFCEKVSKLSGKTPDEIEAHQRDCDAGLKATFGYSASRFSRSFEETLKNFVNNPSTEDIVCVRRLAEHVFYTKAEVYPRTEEVLRTIRNSDYNLGIVTAGEEWVQRRRLEEFYLRPLFRAIKIVETKSSDELVEFCNQNCVEVAESFFVGDSVESDIIPAHSVGLNPVLLRKHKHWSEGETKEVPQEIECTELEKLSDLLTFLSLTPDLHRRVPRRVPAYAIFEGGGAKGLAHVGALQALEDRKFNVRAVAGTSAGAIVAGLCAAGYRADELYTDESGSRGILDFDYLDVLGEEEWMQADKFIDEMKSRLGVLTSPKTGAFRKIRKWLSLGKYISRNKDVLINFDKRKGYFALHKFRDLYDSWLVSKLISKGQLDQDHEGPVQFKHLPKDLYVISTDITGKRLRVHSKESDETECVADAVAASVAIPVVFQPRDLGQPGQPSLHVDGGLLSNFPAWLFATNLLRIDPGEVFVPVFGVELQDKGETAASETEGLFGLGKDLVTTAIAGSKKLETRDMRRLLPIEVPVTIKSYAFKLSEEQRLVTYQEGKAATDKFFRENIHAVSPILMRPYLADAHAKMIQVLESLLGRESLHLRVNVMARVPPDEAVQESDWLKSQQIEILYHYGMDLDPDVLIAFGRDEGGVGACYVEREIQVIDLEWTREAYPVYSMTAIQQALVRRTLKSLMCIPIYSLDGLTITEDTPIIGILNFDSDEDVLEMFDSFDIQDLAMTLADDLAEVWYDLAEYGKVHNVPKA